jgi:asparagine synthase (glutamine-hydrolysing)
LTAKESLDLIPFITDHLDEPMADASILPTFLLSRFTKQSVTVALGGDGGDELFAGYPTFIADYFAPLYRCVPESVRRGFEWLVKLLPASEKNFNFVFKLRTFMQGVVSDPYETHMRWLGSFNQSDREQLLRPKSWAQIASVDVFSRVRTLIAGFGDSTVAQKTLGLYLRTYLMDQVLVKVDRASMYASLEARSPLLDYQVVDFINSLPYSFKLRGLTTKYILKKLMADKLPKEIVWRPKKGFGIPMTQWLKHELKPLCDELFSKELLERQGLFNHTYILKLLDDHRSDRADHRKKIWNLLLFQMWWKRWEH